MIQPVSTKHSYLMVTLCGLIYLRILASAKNAYLRSTQSFTHARVPWYLFLVGTVFNTSHVVGLHRATDRLRDLRIC
jgi:hypothetical protein